MIWTRAALGILGIPKHLHARASDYDIMFRLLTALAEGVNHKDDPLLNESKLCYARGTRKQLGIYSLALGTPTDFALQK